MDVAFTKPSYTLNNTLRVPASKLWWGSRLARSDVIPNTRLPPIVGTASDSAGVLSEEEKAEIKEFNDKKEIPYVIDKSNFKSHVSGFIKPWLSVKSNKFSTYALAYEDKVIEAEKVLPPKTGDINLEMLALGILIGIAGLVIASKKLFAKGN